MTNTFNDVSRLLMILGGSILGYTPVFLNAFGKMTFQSVVIVQLATIVMFVTMINFEVQLNV